MSQDGSNANKSAITVALTVGRATIVAALIAAAAFLPSRGAGGGTNLVAVTTSSQRITSPNSSSPTSAPSTTGSASVPNESSVCATGSIELVGSTAFEPIAQQAAAAYAQACPGATITVSGGDAAYGLTQVRDAVKSGARSMIAMYDGVSTDAGGLKPYPMGFLIFSVVEHTGLFPASSLTTGELRKIFVKPGERGVIAVGRRAGSGTRLTFITKVLGLNPDAPDVTPDQGNCPLPTGSAFSFTSCTEDSTPDLLNFVNGTPNAIGYAEAYGLLNYSSRVSAVSIDGFAPTRENVLNGSYKFWAVEHLYAAAQPTALAKDFLAFLPQYIKSNPPSGFIACSDAPNILEADCHSAIPPHKVSGRSARPAVDILSTGSLVRLVILLIYIIMVAAAFYWWRRSRVLKRPWRKWLALGLVLVAAACISPWSVYVLGSGALDWVVPVLAAIAAALFALWHKLTGQPSAKGVSHPFAGDTDVTPNGSSDLETAVPGPAPQSSQQGARPIQPAIESAEIAESLQPALGEEIAESPPGQPYVSAGRNAFISYSHKDERFLRQLETSLAPLQRDKLISAWHDRKILPGQKWDREIYENLENADIVLLLVSPDFLASEYARGREMLPAVKRRKSGSAMVVPIILRPSDWKTGSLGSLEVLPSNGRPVSRWTDRDEAWQNVVEGLRRLISGQG